MEQQKDTQMEHQTEQKYANLKKRNSWLAAAAGFLFVCICVSVAFLGSILKSHAHVDDDAIALVPVKTIVAEKFAGAKKNTSSSKEKENAGAATAQTTATTATSASGTQFGAGTSGQKSNASTVRKPAGSGNGTMGVIYRDEVVEVPLNPSLTVGDDVQIWETATEVDIFKIRYENGEAIVTVDGGDDKVIAPGTGNEYTFYLKNTGDVKLDYTLAMEAYFTPAEYPIPVEVRLKGYDGNYIIGGEDSWADVLELNNVTDKAAVDVNRYAYYTLEWQWPYESGDDEYDTFLGNKATEEDLTLTIGIMTTATGEDTTTDVIKVPSFIPTGDDAQLLLWVGLAGGSALLLILILLGRKRKEKEEDNEEN